MPSETEPDAAAPTPRFTSEQLEGAIAVVSHLAVLCFGFGLGVVVLGVAVQGANGAFLAGDPVGRVLAAGERWAFTALGASLVCFAAGGALHHHTERVEG